MKTEEILKSFSEWLFNRGLTPDMRITDNAVGFSFIKEDEDGEREAVHFKKAESIIEEFLLELETAKV